MPITEATCARCGIKEKNSDVGNLIIRLNDTLGSKRCEIVHKNAKMCKEAMKRKETNKSFIQP